MYFPYVRTKDRTKKGRASTLKEKHNQLLEKRGSDV